MLTCISIFLEVFSGLKNGEIDKYNIIEVINYFCIRPKVDINEELNEKLNYFLSHKNDFRKDMLF